MWFLLGVIILFSGVGTTSVDNFGDKWVIPMLRKRESCHVVGMVLAICIFATIRHTFFGRCNLCITFVIAGTLKYIFLCIV